MLHVKAQKDLSGFKRRTLQTLLKLRRQVERVIVRGEDLIKALHAHSFH